MKICPSCKESYTYFNSYFGVEMCTNCWWSEDMEEYLGNPKRDVSNKSSDDINHSNLTKKEKEEIMDQSAN